MNIQQIYQQLLIIKLKLEKLILKKKLTIPDLPQPRFIIAHHGGGEWNFNQVNNHHKNKWGFRSSLGYYIGYQYWIGYCGKVKQARRDNEEGAHTVGNTPQYYNRCSIGICLQGDTNKRKPNPDQLKSLKELIDKKKKEYNIPNNRIYGHRRVSRTSCPGNFLYRWLCSNFPDIS